MFIFLLPTCSFPMTNTISYSYENQPTKSYINYAFQNSKFKYCKMQCPLTSTTFYRMPINQRQKAAVSFFRFISCVFSWTIADRSVSIPLRVDPRMNQAQQYFPTDFVGTTAHRYRQGGTYTNSIINLDETDQIYYFLGMSLSKKVQN